MKNIIDKKEKEENKNFWKIAKKNYEEVKTWPKWKQNIIITAEACETGKFLKK